MTVIIDADPYIYTGSVKNKAVCSATKGYSRKTAKIYKKQILTDKQTHYKTVNMLVFPL